MPLTFLQPWRRPHNESTRTTQRSVLHGGGDVAEAAALRSAARGLPSTRGAYVTTVDLIAHGALAPGRG